MTCCQQCAAHAYEHLTSDQRILYCGNCGWEHRESRARQVPPRRQVVPASAAAPAKASRRH